MAKKRVGDGAAYTDDYVGEPPSGKRGWPPPHVELEKMRRAQRAAKLDKAAPLGFAPKGDEARPRRGGA